KQNASGRISHFRRRFVLNRLVVENPTLVASAASAAASAATTTSTTTSTTESTAAAVFTRSRFVYGQVAPVNFNTIQLRDSGLAFGLRGHLDETEAARAARVTVSHDLGRFDSAGL